MYEIPKRKMTKEEHLESIVGAKIILRTLETIDVDQREGVVFDALEEKLEDLKDFLSEVFAVKFSQAAIAVDREMNPPYRVMSFNDLTLNLREFVGTREECIDHVMKTSPEPGPYGLFERHDDTPVPGVISWSTYLGDVVVLPDVRAKEVKEWLLDKNVNGEGYDVIDEDGNETHVGGDDDEYNDE